MRFFFFLLNKGQGSVRSIESKIPNELTKYPRFDRIIKSAFTLDLGLHGNKYENSQNTYIRLAFRRVKTVASVASVGSV